MQRGLGGTALEPIEQRRDTELILGPVMLTLLGCGLFALCALCFVFGYAVGRRGPGESASSIPLPGPGSPSAVQAAGTQAKPSATQSSFQPQVQHSDAGTAASPDAEAGADSQADSDAVSVPVAAPSGAAGSPGNSDSVVHTALPVQQMAGQSSVSGGHVEPAVPQAPSIMVQIAAVSHPEDADVLVSALRKRGYAVTARRDPADGLLHVQVGPFASRSDAAAMRQKLLNDGYNAIVQ